jgi:nucleotide-binding universal stress UspA family protein
MLRRILTALDGSPLAESALPLASSLARASGATLVLAQATATGETLEPYDAANPGVYRYIPPAPTAPSDPLVSREIIHESREYLQTWAQKLHASGIPVETVVVPGDAADVLVDEAQRRHVDLIVMTTHGRSGLGRWLYGSIAEAVLARSTVPVLLVRSGMPTTDLSAQDKKRRILVPLDGSPTAERALPAADKLARAIGAEILLARVVPSSPASVTHEAIRSGDTHPARPSDAYEREAERYLQEIAWILEADGLRASTAVADDHPSDGIIAVAEHSDAAIVVMATHGRTGLGRFILGSVAHDVLRRGTRPVLLVRPTTESATQPADAVTTD